MSSKRMLTSEITDFLLKEISKGSTVSAAKILNKQNFVVQSIFYNADSLRLRSAGYKLLQLFFEYEEFQAGTPIKSGEILTLSQNLNAPFYINHNKLSLFGGEDLVFLKMSGDVHAWIETFN